MCSSVEANDILDELLSENNRLLNELMFANDLIDCLQRLRKCLIDFNSNCGCLQNSDNKTYFQLLDNKYQELIRDKNLKTLTEIQIKEELLESQKSLKRSAEEMVGLDFHRNKRQIISFNEINNIHNEYRTEAIETHPGIWDQSLVVKSEKLSTDLSDEKITEMMSNDECIARLDSINNFIKIFFSIGTSFRDEDIIGFGCRFCSYITNAKQNVSEHVMLSHEEEVRNEANLVTDNQIIQITDPIDANCSNILVEIVNQCPIGGPTDDNNFQYGNYLIIQDLANKTTSSDAIEAIDCGQCEIETNQDTQQMATNFVLESMSEQSNDDSDTDWTPNGVRRRTGSRERGFKFEIKDIRERLKRNECDVEVDPTNPGIKLIHMRSRDPSVRMRIGFGCGLNGCQRIFNKRSHILNHIAIHQNSNVFACDQIGCYFQTRFIKNLNRHKEKHRKNRANLVSPSIPPIEGWFQIKEYTDDVDENANVMDVEEIQQRLNRDECDIESDPSNSRVNLIVLKNSDPNGVRSLIGYKCAEIGCELLFNKRSVILSHISLQHKPDVFKCDHNGCNYQTRTERNLELHKGDHQKIGYNEIMITNDFNEMELIERMNIRRRKTNKKLNRLTLERMLSNNELHVSVDETNELIIVYRTIPRNEADFARIVGYGCNCSDGCNFMAVQKKRLRHHMYIRHNIHYEEDADINDPNSGLFQCHWPECEFTCSEGDQRRITDHMNRHNKVRAYHCHWPQCEYSAYTDSSLRRHIKMHEDIRPFACEWPGCEQRCRSMSRLKEHMIIHGTDRPFKCDWPQCDHGFRSSAALRQHKITHTKDKRFACNWFGCKSTFRDSFGLRQHQLIHKGEFPITCPEPSCAKGFRQKQGMIVHFRKHHPDHIQLLNPFL